MTSLNWNLPPPDGFRGLHPDVPVTIYYRHLPHMRQDGATYFVTVRLVDSLPQSKLRELEGIKREWLKRSGVRPEELAAILRGSSRRLNRQSAGLTSDQWDEFSKMVMQRVESWLDQGMGKCWLRHAEIRQHVVTALHYFDDKQYELGCYVIMPNHVHLVIRPLEPRQTPLEKVLQGRKLYAARQVNATLGRKGALWQEEGFDRIVRDEEHLWRCIQYIGRNPRNARLGDDEHALWIRPSWEAAGWRFVNA